MVLFPQLLSLSINTCLGPRVLYARKRNVKLLKPSVASAVGGSSSSAVQDWIQHRMAPLQLWLSVSEQRMCRLMGLDLQDYRRCARHRPLGRDGACRVWLPQAFSRLSGLK